ncbi:MAG: MetQ/NlpA family ABC transporter substrate-binding protein [Defluviitaleaceae bacterium]|nr:MetQ/NlpA family ABC transporter substrate-binding protein [Defluviitaleaceae bacterium]
MKATNIRNFIGNRSKTAIALFCFALLTACTNTEQKPLPTVGDYLLETIAEVKDLRVGIVTGPYWDMFYEAILPPLREMGYTATPVYFGDFSGPNYALANGLIDINIFQHYVFLNNFKFENTLALSAIMEIPTVSMGVFSTRYSTTGEITYGATASIPDDPSNLARALMVLESANLITLNPAIDKTRATVRDIIANPSGIRFVPLPAHHLVSTLDDYGFSVINGNYAVSSGLNASDSLFQEVLQNNFMNVIAVRTEDLNKRFVRDIIEVIYSEAFGEIITDPNGNYAGFQWPRWLHDAVNETR